MLVSGLLTFTMFRGLVAPQAQLVSTFGTAFDGPEANIVVRNWAGLIATVGGLMVLAAFHAPSRVAAALAAISSKVVFIGLILSFGTQYLAYQAGTAVVADAIMVVLMVIYLMSPRRS
jgi:hypothetical protein